MRKPGKSIVVVAVLTAALLVSMVGIAASAEAQSWYLVNTEYLGAPADDATTHVDDFHMEKTGVAATGSISLASIDSVWWYAEYPAQVDGVAFGENDWTVTIYYICPSATSNVYANVCKVDDSTGDETYLANGSAFFPKVTGKPIAPVSITCFDVPETSQIIYTSERLALRIYHDNTVHGHNIYYYDATTYLSALSSPPTDPGYPVPELPSIILFSAGLITFFSYVLLIKRRAEARRENRGK